MNQTQDQTLIRRTFYIGRDQDAMLERLAANRRNSTKASILREAIDFFCAMNNSVSDSIETDNISGDEGNA